jgi:hypothetical protein
VGVHQKERRMSGGNGADLGQVLALLNGLIAMHHEMRRELAEVRLESKGDIRRLDTRARGRSYLASRIAARGGPIVSRRHGWAWRADQRAQRPPLPGRAAAEPAPAQIKAAARSRTDRIPSTGDMSPLAAFHLMQLA